MNNWSQRYSIYSTTVLRLGLVALFTWFGLTQLLSPGMWTSFVPTWVADLTGLSATKLVLVNGALELVAALLLALRLWLRPVSLLLGLHLLGIVLGVGATAVGVRDFMIAIAAFSLALSGDQLVQR